MIIAVNFQFKQLARRSQEKKSGLQGDSNPWPPRCRCVALPTELWSHTLGARSIYWVHISREEWNDVNYIWKLTSLPIVWLYSSVGRATHRQRGGHGFESRWSPDFLSFFFFQASSFQLLKLEIYCDDHSSLNKYKSIKPRTGLYDSDEYKSNFCLYLSL